VIAKILILKLFFTFKYRQLSRNAEIKKALDEPVPTPNANFRNSYFPYLTITNFRLATKLPA
jgi:hypothetical protein